MMDAPKTFKAMIVEETENKKYVRQIGTKSMDELPDGEILVRVKYSSLNYKDALSATGNKGVTRKFPHTPGIDAAGEVAASATDRFSPGQPVIVTGYDLGMNTPGGFAAYIRVPADWVVPLPQNLSLRESMVFGTAGFTAGLCVSKLQGYGVTPDRGEVLVTGATGGVGSIAVAVLAKIGFRIAAVSGKKDQKPFLEQLGAAEVISREEGSDASGRPMLKARWAGVVDTVGGDILATALKSLQYGGVATCCGLVASPSLSTTVFPFILRGVGLLGVDSVECPMDLRQSVWQKLAGEWKPQGLEGLSSEVGLEELDPQIDRILAGRIRGRVVVRID
jgi:putative YhdH/YhfP family quinone oxidoreductase